jgi:hypothetical protein
MIKHIVLLKLYDEAGGHPKTDNILELKEKLESLPEKIDVVLDFCVGINVTESAHAYDMSLESTFVSADELDEYRNHPDHNAILDFLNLVVKEKVFVDYEY